MRSRDQLFAENGLNIVLHRIPGCENFYVTPSGQIREHSSSSNCFTHRQPAPHSSHHAPNHSFSLTPHQTHPNPQFQVPSSFGLSSSSQHPQQLVSRAYFQEPSYQPKPSSSQHPFQPYPTQAFNTSQVQIVDSYRMAVPAPPSNAHYAAADSFSPHATAPHLTAPHTTAPHTQAIAPSHISADASHISPPQGALIAASLDQQYQQGSGMEIQQPALHQNSVGHSESD